MIPGVDFCGTVVDSSNKSIKKEKSNFKWLGVGENHTGGFSQFARVKSKWLITFCLKKFLKNKL